MEPKVRRQIDWEGVEPEFRAGKRTLRDIGKEFGVSEGGIRKKAKELGWERDLSAKIDAKAEALVRKAEVRSEYASEQEIVDTNAQIQAAAQLAERADIKRARNIVNTLFAEVEAECDNKDDFARLGEILRSEDPAGQDKLNDLYMATISLPQRVKSAKLLADALKVLIELERKVLRIKDDTSLEDVAKKFGEGVGEGLSAAEAYKRLLG